METLAKKSLLSKKKKKKKSQPYTERIYLESENQEIKMHLLKVLI